MADSQAKSLMRQAVRFGVRDIQGKVRAAIEKNIPKLGGIADQIPPGVPTNPPSLPPRILEPRRKSLFAFHADPYSH